MSAAKTTLTLIILGWTVFIASHFAPLTQFGIIPRTKYGLIGIFASPFLHGNLTHLIANSIGLLTVGWVFFVTYPQKSFSNSCLLVFFSGLGTWAIARPGSLVIGASGFIYALIGFVVVGGFKKRKWGPIFAALAVMLTHSGALWGIIPTQTSVSWEAHLAGLLSGAILATSIERLN